MFRKATPNDLDKIEQIYDKTHDAEDQGKTTVGWLRNVYPVRETARCAIADRDDMYVYITDESAGKEKEEIAACAIINRIQVDCYKNAPWEFPAKDSEVLVLHTLVVDPDNKGHGIGKAFAKFYEKTAVDMGCKYLRIDTNEKNIAARNMYRSLGYKEIAVIPTVFNGIPGVNLVLLEKKVNDTI